MNTITSNKLFMKAPRGKTSANIEGNHYDVPQTGENKGIIEVINPAHVPILKRHGFEEYHPAPDPEEIFAQIDAMEDKQDLVNFIEERGGEADVDMSAKKLRRLAKATVSADGSAEDEE
jgi:hypothetical protein